MIEAGVMAWLAAIGYAAMSPLWTRVRPVGLAAMAFPIGASTYVLAGLGLVLVDAFSTLAALVVASVAAGAVAASFGRRRLAEPGAVRTVIFTLGGVVAAAGLLSLVFQGVHLTRLTVDSIRNLLTAEALERTGTLDAVHRGDLRMRQFFVPLLHTAGVIGGRGYAASATPLFALSGFVAAGWFAWEGLVAMATPRRWRISLLAAAAFLVLTTNRIVYHAFYVNGHMVFAVLIVILAGSVWLALGRGELRLLVPAALAVAATPVLRPEAVITSAIFLIPAVTSHRIPVPYRWMMAAPYLAATVAWYGVGYRPHAVATDLGLTGPIYGNLIVAAGVAAAIAVSALPRIGAAAGRAAPWLTFAAVAFYLAVRALEDSDILEVALSATGANIAFDGMWGVFWWVVPLFAVGAVLVARPPLSGIWAVPLLTYGVALFVFAYLRGGGYRTGTGDSGNRMLVHVTLVLVVYLVLAAGRAVAPSGDDGGSG